MLIKQLVCSVLILSLMFSGCAASESAYTSPQEITVMDNEEESGFSFSDILCSALLVAVLLPIYLLLDSDDEPRKDNKRSKHKRGKGRHR